MTLFRSSCSKAQSSAREIHFESLVSSAKQPTSDEQMDDSDDNNMEPEGAVTSYESRRKLVGFCRGLAKHKFERSLMTMAKETKQVGSMTNNKKAG